jgi:glycogen operon protein
VSERDLLPGRPWPLGAHWDGGGVNFALASRHASAVELCLFESPDAGQPDDVVSVGERGDDVWHTYVRGVGPGAAYAYRVHGEPAPEKGHRFDPAVHLVDPYARALSGPVRWADGRATPPRSLVIDPAFDWQGDRPPRVPWSRSVLYECHVKGMTARHPDVPPAQRGRFLGLAHPAIVEHLRSLGVTAVSLLPVHHSAKDAHVARLGLEQYWGYGTLGFFAPDSRFASGSRGEQVVEFKAMVRALHRAGLEVILDVVYNHTPEGDPRGPTLSLRGIDNAGYYRLDPLDRSRYEDFTGCGNSLDARQPRVLQLVMDSLRYWVSEMHVDGFRFDLATVLARGDGEPELRAPFFQLVRQDPVLAGVKLIAEPWDLAPGGYRLGGFPYGWAEWNGRFRDCVRRFWRGDGGGAPELATRLSGSSDFFAASGRTPQASINYAISHDGFTLADLVSYAHRHNEANREDDRDGPAEEFSRNWGAEGPTADRRVRKLRERARRNLIATLAFSLGVPMLAHGDEIGRTQHGNNNAYCHDGELTWLDWNPAPDDERFLAFVRRAFALRAANPVFRRRAFFHGGPINDSELKDVSWLHPRGRELTQADWHDPGLAAFAVLIPGAAADATDEDGVALAGETALLLLNGSPRTCTFELPGEPALRWTSLLSTACERPASPRGGRLRVAAHSLVLLGGSPA